jgi:hypothetical protein
MPIKIAIWSGNRAGYSNLSILAALAFAALSV